MQDKLVLILSEENDSSTDEVIEWLLSFGMTPIRINAEDRIKVIEIDLKKKHIIIEIERKGQFQLYFKSIISYWYRRGDFNNYFEKPIIPQEFDFLLNPIINLYDEKSKVLTNFIHFILNQKKSVGNYFTDTEVNKLVNLSIANEFGLKTPDTFIVTNKVKLKTLLQKYKKFALKSETEGGLFIKHDDYYTDSKTILITNSDAYPDTFEPTLFQEYIEKLFELRVFYLNGNFYASAIFSQLDKKTKIDFRNYNDYKPNRVIPYILSEDLKSKLTKMFNKIGVNSGSFDMIYSTSEEYYFLEINPVGLFQQISYPCNYYLEEKIACELL